MKAKKKGTVHYCGGSYSVEILKENKKTFTVSNLTNPSNPPHRIEKSKVTFKKS